MRIISSLLFALTLVAGGLPLAASADDTQTAITKHAAFAGWSSKDNLAWTASGTAGVGAGAPILTETHRGIVYRLRWTNERGVSNTQGFNGRMVWTADENGFVAASLGRPAQTAIALDILRSEAVADLHPSVVRHSSYAGRAVTILRIQPSGLPPTDVYEDDQTGAYLHAVVAPGSADERTIDDIGYTQAGTRRFLSSWRTSDGDFHLNGFDAGKTIGDSDLQPGAPSAQWSYDNAPVPFSLATMTDNSRIIRIAATVNGRSGIFILSTGAPAIILFNDFAHEAGVDDAGTLPFSPFAGNVDFAGYSRVRSLQIGGSTLRNVIVTRIIDPDNRLAGILGYDFFANAVVNTDLNKSQLTINDPNTPALTGQGGTAFPIDLSPREPVVSITLPNGMMHPILDSSLTGFIIASQALGDSGRLTGPNISSQAAVGFGGAGATGDPIATVGLDITYTDWHHSATSGPCITVNQMFIGPYKYQNPPVCFAGSNVLGNDGGLIGLDFLRHFNWGIDYPHARFVLTPNGL